MGMFSPFPDVDWSGPFFDTDEVVLGDELARNIEHAVADKGVEMVKDRLVMVIRVNHGVYMSWIHTEDVLEGVDVTDRWIVYGPWLEGEGSRNFPVTRFKGYHTFRIVGDQLQFEAGPIAERECDKFAAEMNL